MTKSCSSGISSSQLSVPSLVPSSRKPPAQPPLCHPGYERGEEDAEGDEHKGVVAALPQRGGILAL